MSSSTATTRKKNSRFEHEFVHVVASCRWREIIRITVKRSSVEFPHSSYTKVFHDMWECVCAKSWGGGEASLKAGYRHLSSLQMKRHFKRTFKVAPAKMRRRIQFISASVDILIRRKEITQRKTRYFNSGDGNSERRLTQGRFSVARLLLPKINSQRRLMFWQWNGIAKGGKSISQASGWPACDALNWCPPVVRFIKLLNRSAVATFQLLLPTSN